VKVLDFGLAKAMSESTEDVNMSDSPTLSVAATQHGVILGTAAYMSPEQARGKAVDNRTDIWAFGCVLYEMLTGKRAFEGEDVSDTLAAVLRAEPDWTALREEVSQGLRALLERCLAKDRAKRVDEISIVKFLLTEPAFIAGGADVPRVSSTAEPSRSCLTTSLLIAAALLTAGVGGAVVWRMRHRNRRQLPCDSPLFCRQS
jgi:eukaryotic-like serine/threonine-protein kinase